MDNDAMPKEEIAAKPVNNKTYRNMISENTNLYDISLPANITRQADVIVQD